MNDAGNGRHRQWAKVYDSLSQVASEHKGNKFRFRGVYVKRRTDVRPPRNRVILENPTAGQLVNKICRILRNP
jgi:hypothetical protein